MRQLENFRAALGEFVLKWSDMELCLDLLLLSSRDRNERRKLPHEIAAKLKQLRKHAERSELAQQRSAIIQLASDIETMTTQRHDYVHGAALEMFEKQHPMTVMMGRMLQPKNRERQRPVKVTSRMLRDAAHMAFTYGTRALDLAEIANKNCSKTDVQSL